MQNITLLDRARQIIKSRKAKMAVAIVPIALSASARAGTVTFVPGTKSLINAGSGGTYGYGHIDWAATPNGIRLFGDTIENSLGLSVADSDQNAGAGLFYWDGSLSGDTHEGEIFSLYHNFSIGVTGENAGTVEWILDASIDIGGDVYSYTLNSTGTGLGDFSGFVQHSLAADGTDGTWSADLLLYWHYDKNLDGSPVNPNARLSVNIPDSGSVDLSISAVPLPPAFWAGMPLLGLVAWVQRKSTPKSV